VSRRFSLTVLMALVLMALVAPVQAQDAGTKQVGLVIAFPDGTQHTEIVTVPAAANTFEVLQAADIELASQDTAFGPAVCSINGTGCPADNCFCNEKEFWAYFHLDNTQWASAMEGVGAYVPADGAVEGFAWSASDADFNPTVKPNVVAFDQITSSAAAAATGVGLSTQTIILLVAIVALIAILVVLYLRRTKRLG
jgi:hypothetical protein